MRSPPPWSAALKVQLNGSTATRGHGTTNPEAYNAYLLGRQLHMQGTVPSWRQAIEAYQKAIGLDPYYADAYADLAVSEYFLADQTGDPLLANWPSRPPRRRSTSIPA